MAAIIPVATFEEIFMRKSISIETLKNTIKNSNIRLQDNLTATAAQTEKNRIQGAANAIAKRGTFSQKISTSKDIKEVKKQLNIHDFINNHKKVLAVGGVALLLLGGLVARK